MTQRDMRAAAIGAGTTGRAHADGHHNLRPLWGDAVPRVKPVAVADAPRALAADVAGEFGFERVDTSWEAFAEAELAADERARAETELAAEGAR